MRDETLVGYLLHQRSYQEKRAIYYLFSKQHGVVHGIGKKGAPLFEPLQLFATGKRELKTFTQITMISLERLPLEEYSTELPAKPKITKDAKRYGQIQGQQQYAALYLNEILWKLLPSEDPMPVLWQHYQESLNLLKQPLSAAELRLCLRQFEQQLFKELGFSLSLTEDSSLDAIDAASHYRFVADSGFVPVLAEESIDRAAQGVTSALFSGEEILLMTKLGIVSTTIQLWSRLNRQLIDQLLDYQPLQSRLLWQQQQRYQ